MITYINKANADKYRVLFADATKALQEHDVNGKPVGEVGAGDPVLSSEDKYQEVSITAEEFAGGDYYIYDDVSSSWIPTEVDAEFDEGARYAIKIPADEAITTLEEYFSYIADLNRINKRFTILPLDEEYFEINANARTIAIPQNFRSNGIAVQGDEVAEILYFKINRFFDMDDLYGKDIFIQWRAPADTEGKRQEGVSVPWVIDIETVPGYIVFGWPLASEITKRPGNLDFAVRFYTYNEDEKKITYSLSTLTATALIKEALNYNLEDMLLDGTGIVDSNDLIINRLVNSDVFDPSLPDPLEPTLIDDIVTAFNKESQLDEDGEKTIYNVYLTNPDTGEETDGSYKVQATSDDSGTIGYTWIKKNLDGDLVQNSLTSGIKYYQVDDTEYNSNKIYYTKSESMEGVYEPFVFSEEIPDLDTAAGMGITLYERFSEATLNSTGNDVTGSYQVRITNRVGRKTNRIYGNIVLIQGPVAPEITKDITVDSTGIFSNEDNTLNVSVTADTDEHSYVTYTWQKAAALEGPYEDLYTSQVGQYAIIGDDYGEANDGDGYYRVHIRSKLNSVIEEVTGESLRVTHAALPVSIQVSASDLPNQAYDINKPISVTATPDTNEKRTADDSITYQWYRYNGTNDELVGDFNDAAIGNYLTKENDIALENADTASITIPNTAANENGYYFCEVTNHYNGTTAVKCSSFFNVVDTKVEI